MPPRALAISAPMPLCVAVFRAVGFSSRCFFFPFVAHSVFCLPRICGATRLSLAGYLFAFSYFIF
jgi:hypothetical protein